MLKYLRKCKRKNVIKRKNETIGKNAKLIDDIKALVFYLDKQGPNLTYRLPNKHLPFSEADFITVEKSLIYVEGRTTNLTLRVMPP